jgi:hypothetical protein
MGSGGMIVYGIGREDPYTSIPQYITFGASLKWLNFKYFSHLTPKISLVLAVSSHFTITPVLAKKQICSKWDIQGAFAPNLEPKWEKSLVKTSTIGY